MGAEHETLCGLTKAPPDFENSCPTYAYEDAPSGSSGGGTSPWRIIFSVLILILALGRLLMTCSKMNDQHNTELNPQDLQRLVREVQAENRDQVGSLTPEMRAELGITVLTHDTTLRIDQFMDFTVPRGNYIITNILDDTVKAVIRDTRNGMAFLHRFRKSDDVIEAWRNFRTYASNQIVDSQLSFNKVDERTFDYVITNSLMSTHGRARIYHGPEYSYVFQCEHQSDPAEKVQAYFAKMETLCVHLK